VIAVLAPAFVGVRTRAILLLALRLGLAAVFITAAIPKIAAPDLFAGNVFNYKILPPWGVNTLALVLPWLELFAGVGLALGVWPRACAWIMAGLMVVFMAAFVSARARGLDISCGCFEIGTHAKPTSALWVVVRDMSFLLAALAIVRFGAGPGLGRKARAGSRLR
jgi:uncharacterized membrane protein YphA (DoxX/SURF4 family)